MQYQHESDDEDDEENTILVKFVGDPCTIPSLVREVVAEKNWEEFDPNKHRPREWNLLWKNGRFRTSDFKDIEPWQRLNHQPCAATNFFQQTSTSKDGLLREMRILQSAFGKSVINFVPNTFLMPREERQFKQDFTNKKEKQSNNFWIFKPTDKSRGRGIFVFNNTDQLRYSEKSIVQEYIANPYLISGYKFDLRLYAVVVSFRPFIVYICSEGLVRFGTEKYDLQNLGNLFSHLTNTSINVGGARYEEKKVGVGSGCKWSLNALRNYFYSRGIDDSHIFTQINNIITMTLLAQSKGVTNIVSNCYELYGFDIILDETLKPWLLEVNYSPALAVDCATDDAVKRNMLDGLFDMLCFQEADKQRCRQKQNKNRRWEDSSDSGISSAHSFKRPKSSGSSSIRSRGVSRADSIKRSESRNSILESIDEQNWEDDAKDKPIFLGSRDSSIYDDFLSSKRPKSTKVQSSRLKSAKSTPNLPAIFNVNSERWEDKNPSTMGHKVDNDMRNFDEKIAGLPDVMQSQRRPSISNPVRINRAAFLRSQQAQNKMQALPPQPLVVRDSTNKRPPLPPKQIVQQPRTDRSLSLQPERRGLGLSKKPQEVSMTANSRPRSKYAYIRKKSISPSSEQDDNDYDDISEMNETNRRHAHETESRIFGGGKIQVNQLPKKFGSFCLVFPFNKATQAACRDTRTTDRVIARELHKLVKQSEAGQKAEPGEWSVSEVWPAVKSVFA